MTLRAGLVGAGYISKFHVRALKRLEGVEIVGVTDLNLQRAEQFAKENAIAAFPSVRALRDAGAEVIHVATPPAAHAAVALEALELGCHVFVEKPLATSAEDCTRIEEAAKRLNRSVCVGHSLLYDPLVQRALDMVRRGDIGDVIAFDYYRCQNQQSYPIAAVSPEQQRGGYPFRDIGIHALYLAEAFVGPIVELDSRPLASGRGNANLWVDEYRVLAKSAQGTAQIHLSWNVRPQQNVFVVQGTRGVIRGDLFGMALTVKKPRPMPEHAARVVNAVSEGTSAALQSVTNVVRVATGRLRQFHGIQALVAEFYARLARGEQAPVLPGDARRAVQWAEVVARQADEIKDAWATRITAHRSGARTLVTGGTGFIGKHLVRRLLQRGEAIRLLVRSEPEPEIAQNPLVEVVLGDLGDGEAVNRATQGIDTVYHVGATMRGGANEFARGTVTGTRLMVDACLRHQVTRLVYMSSLAVIDTDAGTSITEESPLETQAGDRGHYTRAKLDAETIVTDAIRDRALPAVILRPGEVVAPEKPLLTAGVAQRIGRTLVVLGNGNVKLPLVHVADVVDALLEAARPEIPVGTLVQLVENSGVTQNSVIEHYLTTTKTRHRVIRVPMPIVLAMAWGAERLSKPLLGAAPIGVRRIRAATASRHFDCSRAARILGWAPRAGVKSVFTAADGSSSRPVSRDLVARDVPGSAAV